MIRTTTQNSISTRVMLILLALVILVQPMLVASSPTVPERLLATDTLTASAERYITSLSEVVRLSTALIGPIDAVRTTPPPQLPEAFVVQTRQQALDLAVQSAIAIGAVDDFTSDIAKLGGTLPPAIDIAQTVAAGLPPETKLDFQQVVGLSTTQITDIEQSLQELATTRFAIAQTGLPQETQNQLLQAGFSQTDVGRITTTLANQGLATPALPTRLEQFRATKWELSTLRMRALILATQMMARSIDARQAHGVAAQAASQTDLTELANDELRLLTHIAALRSEWGTDPRLDRGEGQWWFIERYAQRAGERLEQLMLRTRNPAFAVDLLFIDQMRTLAITARSGDPASVTSELDHLNDLLAFQLGDPVVDGRQVVGSTGAGASASAQLSDIDLRVDAAIPVDTAAQARIVLVTNNRLLEAQTVSGEIVEANEANNAYAFIFPYVANTQVQLAPEVTAALEANFGHVDPAREKQIAWFWGVVTGQSDDWTALAGNFVFSVIPVIGIIPDLATLALDEGWFVKALAIIGIIASIGDLVALIPVFEPVAAGSVATDAAASGLKIAYKAEKSVAKDILKGIPTFEYAFNMAKGLTGAVGAKFVKDLKELRDLPKVIAKAPETCKEIWKSFDALVRYLGSGKLLKVHITEGAVWIGGLIDRMLQRGGRLSDDGFEVLIHISEDIGDAPLRQSEEAGDALLDLANDFDEGALRRLLDETSCLVSAVARAPSHSMLAVLFAAPVAYAESDSLCDGVLKGAQRIGKLLDSAKSSAILDTLNELPASTREQILTNVTNWDDAAATGFQRLVQGNGVAQEWVPLLQTYAGNPVALQNSLRLISRTEYFTEWSPQTIETLVDFVRAHGDDFTDSFMQRVSTNIDLKIYDEQFRKMLSRINQDPVIKDMLDVAQNPRTSDEIADGVAKLLRYAEHPKTRFFAKPGYNYQLDRAKSYFSNSRLRAVEHVEEIGDEEFMYDLVLDNLSDGPVVEVKYWTSRTLDQRKQQLIDQIQKYADQEREVIVEFGQTRTRPITGDMLDDIFDRLEAQGVNLDQIKIILNP
jgi:hypothetical protein